MLNEENILEIIKEECEISGVRKYTCINGFGFSQLERNIASRVMELKNIVSEKKSLIQVLTDQENKGGGNSKITVSMLKCFLEEIEKDKKVNPN